MPGTNTPGRPPDNARTIRTFQTQLEPLVGVDVARILAPPFAQTAAIYWDSQTETDKQADRRHEAAEKQLAALDSILKGMKRLSKGVDALIAMVPEAYAHAYLPGSDARSGTLGRLGVEAAMQGKLNRIQEAARRVTPDLHAWRLATQWDMRRKRGRKIGDRRFLNEWVVIQLAGAGVRVKKNPDGIVAKVLGIMYKAIGIEPPQDLYRDIVIAIDATARERQNLH